jgi:hypothetical protein
VGFIVDPLPLKRDLPIVEQYDKKAKAMMHGDEGIGVEGLTKHDPGPIPMIASTLMTLWNI